MAASLEASINRLLDGLPVISNDICDYSYEDQNKALMAQGVTDIKVRSNLPVLGDSVVYIVACVFINENDEVLLIQEAKKSCAGKWYLPAGRIEPNENIYDAGVREVLEETGLLVEFTKLIMIESAKGSWFRFVLVGKVVGGQLKTLSQADQESLQAMWVKHLDEVPLRANDILALISKAREYYSNVYLSKENLKDEILPVQQSHEMNLLRLVICSRSKKTNDINILVALGGNDKFKLGEDEVDSSIARLNIKDQNGDKNEGGVNKHFPTCEINLDRSIHSTLRRFLQEIFGNELLPHKLHGVLSIEHNSKDSENHDDGICLTLLISFREAAENVPVWNSTKYLWMSVNKQIGSRLLEKINTPNSTIPLNVIR